MEYFFFFCLVILENAFARIIVFIMIKSNNFIECFSLPNKSCSILQFNLKANWSLKSTWPQIFIIIEIRHKKFANSMSNLLMPSGLIFIYTFGSEYRALNLKRCSKERIQSNSVSKSKLPCCFKIRAPLHFTHFVDSWNQKIAACKPQNSAYGSMLKKPCSK